jgi:hypothetical protein
MTKERLRQKILDYADSLKKKNPELAKKIKDNVDKLVNWYVVNKRDLEMEDFLEIVEGMKVKVLEK